MVRGSMGSTEMLDEPCRGSPRGGGKIGNIGIEMATLEGDGLFGMDRPLVGSERLVGNGQVIAESDNEEQGRWTDKPDIRTRLIFHEHLDRA